MLTVIAIVAALVLVIVLLAIAVAVYAINQAFLAEGAAEDITPPSDLPGPSRGHPKP